MPYDDDDLTDPYEDELDGEFLSRYKGGGAVLTMGSPWGDDEDDDEDEEGDQWSGISPRDELTKLVVQCRQNNVPLTNIERVVQLAQSEAQSEAHRIERRNYNARYRAGLIPPVVAKSFTRRSKCDTAMVERKKMTYYLPLETHQRLKEYVKSHRLARREFCVCALEAWLNAEKPHTEIIGGKFTGRVFVFDEIPSELWNRVDLYCRASGEKRSVRLYQVVEAAISEALASELIPQRRAANKGQKRTD